MENNLKKWNLKQDKEQQWVNWRCHHFLWVQAHDFNLLWPRYNILSDLINIAITSRFPLALSKTYLLDRNALQNEIKRSKLTEVVRTRFAKLAESVWPVSRSFTLLIWHQIWWYYVRPHIDWSISILTCPLHCCIFFAVRRTKKAVSFRATLNHF